jgi:hypothetical protein
MRSTSHHISRAVAVALVTASAIAPTAAADHQDLRSPDTRDAAIGLDRPTEELTFPGLARWNTPGQDLRMPDTKDAAAGRTAPVVEFVRVSDASGFDWADAGLGAAAAFGIALIGAGGALTMQRRRPVTS